MGGGVDKKVPSQGGGDTSFWNSPKHLYIKTGLNMQEDSLSFSDG